MVVSPPSDMPITACAFGARARIAAATSSALLGDVDRAVAAAVGVPVAGEVDGDERAAQRHGDGVPRVRVLRAAVQEHELGLAVAPHERAQPAAVGSTSTDSRRTVGGPS